jgi:hypothetical protein
MATDAQVRALHALTDQLRAEEATVLLDYGPGVVSFEDLSRAEASALIDELKAEVGDA